MARNIVKKVLKRKFISLSLERAVGYYTSVVLNYQTSRQRAHSEVANRTNRTWMAPRHTIASVMAYRDMQYSLRPQWEAIRRCGFLPDSDRRVARGMTRFVYEDSDI